MGVYCRTKRPRNCTIPIKVVPACRNEKRKITLGGIHKQVSVMLNIKQWRGLARDAYVCHMTCRSCHIHSLELLLLVLLLVLLAMGILPGLISCNNIGLVHVSLILSSYIGITCLISLYYMYKASQSGLFCHPILI